MARPTAATLIVSFLACVGEARRERIVRYMETNPLSFAPGTTRNVLSKLTLAGRIKRVGYGRYRSSAPPAELETKPAALATH